MRKDGKWNVENDLKCCTEETLARECDPEFKLGSTNCKTKLIEYCKTHPNPNSTRCNTKLKKWDIDIYNTIMEERCKDDQLTTKVCKDFCKNTNLCDRALREYCKYRTKSSQSDKICACYYPDNFYDTYHKNILAELQLPDSGLINSSPECMFPKCQKANIKNNNANCPDVNIAKCFNNVDINNEGKISGDIKINTACQAKFCIEGGCYDRKTTTMSPDATDNDATDNVCTHNGCDRQEITTTLPPNDGINGGSDGGADSSSTTNGGSAATGNGVTGNDVTVSENEWKYPVLRILGFLGFCACVLLCSLSYKKYKKE